VLYQDVRFGAQLFTDEMFWAEAYRRLFRAMVLTERRSVTITSRLAMN
jgi:hypothetical protein